MPPVGPPQSAYLTDAGSGAAGFFGVTGGGILATPAGADAPPAPDAPAIAAAPAPHVPVATTTPDFEAQLEAWRNRR